MGALHDPERCPHCQSRGKVVESRHEGDYRRRRRKCPNCGHTWASYESVLDVQLALAKAERRRETTPPPPPAPDPPAAPPVTGDRPAVIRGRRVSRSPYLGR